VCLSRRPTVPPINERRLCSEWDEATRAAKILQYAGQERVPEAGPSRSEAEITLARILSRCQMRIYCTKENIAYSMETSPQVRAHVINRLLSTVRYCSCKYRMPVSRNVVFFPARAVRECGTEKSHRSSEYHAEARRGALADLRWPELRPRPSPTRARPYGGIYSNPLRSDYPAGHCRAVASPSYIG
jgi:hypothetical protein